MTNNDLTKNRFLAGPILPPLLQFAFPLMLSQLLQAFYGGVDLMVVGQYSSTASVSAVATANNGQMKRVANSTFIITPYNVDIMGDLLDELESNGVFF